MPNYRAVVTLRDANQYEFRLVRTSVCANARLCAESIQNAINKLRGDNDIVNTEIYISEGDDWRLVQKPVDRRAQLQTIIDTYIEADGWSVEATRETYRLVKAGDERWTADQRAQLLHDLPLVAKHRGFMLPTETASA